MSDLAVIIANWNGKKYLKDCLDSLRGQTYKNFKTILVDNGSGDGSVFFAEKNYPEVSLIRLKENTGFCRANNIAVEKALENREIKYVIFLNNDTKADSRYIEELVACARRHPDAGAIQPKVVDFFNPGIIDNAGLLIHRWGSAWNRGGGERDQGQFEKEEEIFGANATASLYLREALEKTKLGKGEYFDNLYFAYCEDVDLAWRLRLAGFHAFYAPRAKVFHLGSATGKKNSSFKSFHIHRNQYYNVIKNFPFWFMLRAFLFSPVRYLLLFSSVLARKGAAARIVKEKKNESTVKIVIKSWSDLAVNLKKLIAKRKIVQRSKAVGNREIKNWFSRYGADIGKIIYG